MGSFFLSYAGTMGTTQVDNWLKYLVGILGNHKYYTGDVGNWLKYLAGNHEYHMGDVDNSLKYLARNHIYTMWKEDTCLKYLKNCREPRVLHRRCRQLAEVPLRTWLRAAPQCTCSCVFTGKT